MENKDIQKLTEAIENTYVDGSGINFIDVFNLPLRDRVYEILDLLIEVIFPGYTGMQIISRDNVGEVIGRLVNRIDSELSEQSERALRHQCRLEKCPDCDCHLKAKEATRYLIERIPKIRQFIKTDIGAAFDGDPAAHSFDEIVLSYPGLFAIATNRIAHELYLQDIPLIPRIMSEKAHQKTGIDIHPGAKIGERFFIDHGTGVVIGETSIIGKNVRFYQGVSLIAMSIPKDARKITGRKRHPTIEDDVTIYAEATILGDITIGIGSMIGGNVWIKNSVPPDMVVSTANPELVYKERRIKKEKKQK